MQAVGVAAMVLEIERLRRVLAREHATTCKILRTDAPCSCGRDTRVSSDLAEVKALRELVAHQREQFVRRVRHRARRKRIEPGDVGKS